VLRGGKGILVSMSDEQTEILRGIWQELKDLGQNLGERIDRTNERLDDTREALRGELAEMRRELLARIDGTNSRIDETNSRLDKVEEALKDLAGQQLMLTRYVGTVVDRHEQAIADLRERLARLEGQAGPH
jgi:predicted  nucleic acid-binding Zn-ribbon protein